MLNKIGKSKEDVVTEAVVRIMKIEYILTLSKSDEIIRSGFFRKIGPPRGS